MNCKVINQTVSRRQCVCGNCKKEFSSQLRKDLSGKDRHQSFCSIGCRTEHKKIADVSFSCLCCGKIKTYSHRNYNGNKFCSKTCGGLYASVKTTLKDPNLPMHNLRYKYKAFVFHGFSCQDCGWDEDPKLLCIHHSKGKRCGNDVKNLRVLCPICHAKCHYHGGPTWTKQYNTAKKVRKLYEENKFFRDLFIEETGEAITDSTVLIKEDI